MKKKAQLARPSNLPGIRHGRKMMPGPCAKCGTEGPLLKGFCRRCYQREGRPQKESPSWVADWLKHQVENYLKESVSHFDRNGTRYYVMTEDQALGLCRLIYLAKHHHNDKRGCVPTDNYARRDRRREGEGDGFYLDKSISPELGRLK